MCADLHHRNPRATCPTRSSARPRRANSTTHHLPNAFIHLVTMQYAGEVVMTLKHVLLVFVFFSLDRSRRASQSVTHHCFFASLGIDVEKILFICSIVVDFAVVVRGACSVAPARSASLPRHFLGLGLGCKNAPRLPQGCPKVAPRGGRFSPVAAIRELRFFAPCTSRSGKLKFF